MDAKLCVYGAPSLWPTIFIPDNFLHQFFSFFLFSIKYTFIFPPKCPLQDSALVWFCHICFLTQTTTSLIPVSHNTQALMQLCTDSDECFIYAEFGLTFQFCISVFLENITFVNYFKLHRLISFRITSVFLLGQHFFSWGPNQDI